MSTRNQVINELPALRTWKELTHSIFDTGSSSLDLIADDVKIVYKWLIFKQLKKC